MEPNTFFKINSEQEIKSMHFGDVFRTMKNTYEEDLIMYKEGNDFMRCNNNGDVFVSRFDRDTLLSFGEKEINNPFNTKTKGEYILVNDPFGNVRREYIETMTTQERIEELQKEIDELKKQEEYKLPKIGCQDGEESKNHIKYGDVSLPKKVLKHMERVGISYINVTKDGEKFRVDNKSLKQIYKVANRSWE